MGCHSTELRIEVPTLCSVAGIQSEDDVEWRSEIESVPRKDRCGLKRRKFSAFGVAVYRMSVKGPNGMKLTDIAASDLGRPGKAQAARISAVGWPTFTNRR
jgi:hypothetical protein